MILLVPTSLRSLHGLLLLGERFDVIGVESAELAALFPVLVASLDVKDVLVELISGHAECLGVISCYKMLLDYVGTGAKLQ